MPRKPPGWIRTNSLIGKVHHQKREKHVLSCKALQRSTFGEFFVKSHWGQRPRHLKTRFILPLHPHPQCQPPSRNSVCPQTGPPIYAEASGNPANPSVVFAHGFALSGIVFNKLFSDPRMLEKLYLVRYDVRGHGRSGKPNSAEGYASSLYAADFAAVAAEFSLHMPVLVGCDICSHISPVPPIGAIALGGALCVATAAPGAPTQVRLPDVVTALETHVEFINACFADLENMPFADKAAWIGSTVLQPPSVTTAISAGHKPDQTELVVLGAQGFPAMILYGTEDQIQDGAVAAAEARPYFTDLEVAAIEGGSHSVFYDSLDETVGHILVFCLRVNGQKHFFLRVLVGRSRK
ncbi:Alpha/Beta hydrolase protein [Mycena olivaceomarginata]|nr:Alpha/Beta hydrolase protein [Mycena olivaceomarginata]